MIGQCYDQIRWEQSEGLTLSAGSNKRSLSLLRLCCLQGASHLKGFISDLVDGEVLAVFQASHKLIPHLLVLLPNVFTEVYFVPATPPELAQLRTPKSAAKTEALQIETRGCDLLVIAGQAQICMMIATP